MKYLNQKKISFILLVTFGCIFFLIVFAGGGGGSGSNSDSGGGKGGGGKNGGSGGGSVLNDGDWYDVHYSENWTNMNLHMSLETNCPGCGSNPYSPPAYSTGTNTCPSDNFPQFNPSWDYNCMITVTDLDAGGTKTFCRDISQSIKIPYNHRYQVKSVYTEGCSRAGASANNPFAYVRMQWQALQGYQTYENSPSLIYFYNGKLNCP